MIGVMVVAVWAAHRRNGFFIFRKGEGWSTSRRSPSSPGRSPPSVPVRCRSITPSTSRGTRDGWIGSAIAGVLGVGGALLQLAVCYRPAR